LVPPRRPGAGPAVRCPGRLGVGGPGAGLPGGVGLGPSGAPRVGPSGRRPTGPGVGPVGGRARAGRAGLAAPRVVPLGRPRLLDVDGPVLAGHPRSRRLLGQAGRLGRQAEHVGGQGQLPGHLLRRPAVGGRLGPGPAQPPRARAVTAGRGRPAALGPGRRARRPAEELPGAAAVLLAVVQLGLVDGPPDPARPGLAALPLGRRAPLVPPPSSAHRAPPGGRSRGPAVAPPAGVTPASSSARRSASISLTTASMSAPRPPVASAPPVAWAEISMVRTTAS